MRSIEQAKAWLSPRLVGLVIVLCATSLYSAFLWNRFVGLSSNWFLFYGDQIAKGHIPYRDFYLYVPPLLPLKLALLVHLAGDNLLYTRLLAIFERILLAGILFWWLSGAFRLLPALLATVAAFTLFLTDTADAIPLHHYESVFWSVVAGFCLTRALSRHHWAYFAAAGCAACLSLLAKQTTGLFVTIAMLAILIRARVGPRAWSAYVIAWLSPLIAVLLWLLNNHALKGFIDQVFVSGSTSKGSPLSIALRPLLVTAQNRWLLEEAVAACILAPVVVVLYIRNKKIQAGSATSATMLLVATFAICAAILAAYYASTNGFSRFGQRINALADIILYASFLFTGVITCVSLIDLGQGRRRLAGIMSIVAFASAYGLSLSWPIYAAMAIPCVAITLAVFFDALPNTRPLMLGAVALSSALVFYAAVLRYHVPFSWQGWAEPPLSSAVATADILPGFRLSKEAAEFVRQAVSIIDQHSAPDSKIFVFPFFPLLYTLSNRQPVTFSPVHFFDVTPDSIAIQDADRLRCTPPTVIVYRPFTENEIIENERLFRDGRRSGQRVLIQAIESLRNQYDRVAVLTEPESKRAVEIWTIRNTQWQAAH